MPFAFGQVDAILNGFLSYHEQGGQLPDARALEKLFEQLEALEPQMQARAIQNIRYRTSW